MPCPHAINGKARIPFLRYTFLFQHIFPFLYSEHNNSFSLRGRAVVPLLLCASFKDYTYVEWNVWRYSEVSKKDDLWRGREKKLPHCFLPSFRWRHFSLYWDMHIPVLHYLAPYFHACSTPIWWDCQPARHELGVKKDTQPGLFFSLPKIALRRGSKIPVSAIL